MDYLIKEEDHFPAKVTIFSNISHVIGQIRDCLSENQLEMFRRTCFGIFLDVGEISVSGQLIHQLLLRQVESHDVDFGDIGARLNMKFANRMTSFGITNFALITGLVCRDVPDISSLVDTGVHRLRELWFDGAKSIKRYQLEICFFRLCRREKERQVDEEVVKLALIYFLEFVLVAKERHRAIDNRWLQLVDNLDAFNNFPWGTVSYQRTVASLAGIMVNRVEKRKKRPTKKEQYCIYGFPMVLQIWSYEAIPVIGSRYASKIRDVIPRLLNWSSYQTPDSKELLTIFQQAKLQVHTMLAANGVEMEQEYWIDVSNRMGERSMKEDSESASDSSDHTTPVEQSSHSHGHTEPVEQSFDAHVHTEPVEQPIDADIEDQPRKSSVVADVNAKLDSLKEQVHEGRSLIRALKSEFLYSMTVVNKCVEDTLFAMMNFIDRGDVVGGSNVKGGVPVSVANVGVMTDAEELAVVEEAHNVDTAEVENAEMVEKGKDGSIVVEGEVEAQVDAEEQRDADFLLLLSSMGSFTPVKENKDHSGVQVVTSSKFPIAPKGGVKPYLHNKMKRARNPGPLIRTPFTSLPTKKRKPSDASEDEDVLQEDKPKFDIKRMWPKQWADDLFEFLKDSSRDAERLNWSICDVTKQWFMEAIKPDAWLTDQHLDVAMHLIRKRMVQNPDYFEKACVVLDCLFFTRIREMFDLFKSNPDDGTKWDEDGLFVDYVVGMLPLGGVHWLDAKFVYFSANFNNAHWVAVELDLEKKMIKMYDSLPSITSTVKLKGLFDPLSKMLPYVLHNSGLGDGLFAAWKMQRIPGCPRQSGGGDCGMFAIKFIEALTAGLPVNIIDQSDIMFYRQKFCIEAWKQEFIL